MKKQLSKGADTQFIQSVLGHIYKNDQVFQVQTFIHLRKIQEYFFSSKTSSILQEDAESLLISIRTMKKYKVCYQSGKQRYFRRTEEILTQTSEKQKTKTFHKSLHRLLLIGLQRDETSHAYLRSQDRFLFSALQPNQKSYSNDLLNNTFINLSKTQSCKTAQFISQGIQKLNNMQSNFVSSPFLL